MKWDEDVWHSHTDGNSQETHAHPDGGAPHHHGGSQTTHVDMTTGKETKVKGDKGV